MGVGSVTVLVWVCVHEPRHKEDEGSETGLKMCHSSLSKADAGADIARSFPAPISGAKSKRERDGLPSLRHLNDNNINTDRLFTLTGSTADDCS